MAVTRGESSQCLAATHIETGYTATTIRATCHRLKSEEKDEASDQSSTHTWPPDSTQTSTVIQWGLLVICFCNTFSQTWWLKTTQIYHPKVL